MEVAQPVDTLRPLPIRHSIAQENLFCQINAVIEVNVLGPPAVHNSRSVDVIGISPCANSASKLDESTYIGEAVEFPFGEVKVFHNSLRLLLAPTIRRIR